MLSHLNVEDGADVTDATNVNAAGAVMNSDYTPAHSILVQQSGTGSPTALQIGNNTLVGRLAGGGSNIDDLSTSQVRTLINVEDGAEVNNISDTNATDLTDGGDTTLHIHDSRYYTESETDTLLNAKVTANTAITGATKTKITYDAKGLVTAGADAGIADITGLQTALDNKVDDTEKGANNGVATLDA